MNVTEVVLLAGPKIEVRRLGMFELDDIPKDIPGPYTALIKFGNGEEYHQRVELTTPRNKPSGPFEGCEIGSADWHDWRDWYTWQEGLAHSRVQYEAYVEYCDRVATHITTTCILTKIDHNLIVVEDWADIYAAALCPTVTMEDIAASLQLNFQLSV